LTSYLAHQIESGGNILYDESFASVVKRDFERCGDGMVSSCVLDDESFIANHPFEYNRFLNGPFTNITELFLAGFGLFRGVRR